MKIGSSWICKYYQGFNWLAGYYYCLIFGTFSFGNFFLIANFERWTPLPSGEDGTSFPYFFVGLSSFSLLGLTGCSCYLMTISNLFFYFLMNLLGKLLETMKSRSLPNSCEQFPLPPPTSIVYFAVLRLDVFLALGLASSGKMELLFFWIRQKLVE